MDPLRKQVARARRRLVLEQFLARLVGCLLVALIAAAVAIALPRVVVIANLPADWDIAWLVGALAAGLVTATVWTAVSKRSSLDAAIEIDRRFDLRERVASSLSLSAEDQDTDVGRAVVNDALRAIRRIDVDERFRVGVDRRAWWPLVPAAVAFVLIAWVDNRQAESSIDPASAAAVEKQLQQSAESLRQRIEERRREAEERGLKAAEDLFEQIEHGTRELSERQNVDRTQAAVKLNDLAKQLEQRRQQVGGKDNLRQQFQNMKGLAAGPAEKAAQAMKQGDWRRALDEVDNLAQALRDGQLDDQAKQQLAQQLEQMNDHLEAAALAHRQAMDDLQKQIQQAQQRGDLDRAGQLQQQLDQLAQQLPQIDRMQQLAQQLCQVQEGLEQGDAQQAAAALADLADQLDTLQREMDELEMLDAALDQLELAKNMMACNDCAGGGCAGCQGGFGDMAFGDQFGGQQSGSGIGKGRGFGRPDELPDTSTRDTRVRQDPGPGAAVFGGLVEGPNVRGEVAQAIQEEMASLGAEPADPLTSERLPSSRREHAEQYFQILRDGM